MHSGTYIISFSREGEVEHLAQKINKYVDAIMLI